MQDCLDAGREPSILKVYVAAIFHLPIGDRLVGKHLLVMGFLRGAQRLHPCHSNLVLVWSLSLVLSALSEPPFEPLHSAELKVLSFKTALLLALACGKRVGDLHPLYPVHALQAFLDRTSHFRLVEQLFVCFGGHTKGLPLSKQWLSHRIMEAIAFPSLSALVMKKSMSSALSRQAHRLFSWLGDTTQQDCTHSP